MKRYLYWLVGIALAALVICATFPYFAKLLEPIMSTIISDSMGGN